MLKMVENLQVPEVERKLAVDDVDDDGNYVDDGGDDDVPSNSVRTNWTRFYAMELIDLVY